jgi:hypothetical protein
MIAVPLLLGANPSSAAFTSATNACAPIRHRLPDFRQDLLRLPVEGEHVGFGGSKARRNRLQGKDLRDCDDQ